MQQPRCAISVHPFSHAATSIVEIHHEAEQFAVSNAKNSGVADIYRRHPTDWLHPLLIPPLDHTPVSVTLHRTSKTHYLISHVSCMRWKDLRLPVPRIHGRISYYWRDNFWTHGWQILLNHQILICWEFHIEYVERIKIATMQRLVLTRRLPTYLLFQVVCQQCVGHISRPHVEDPCVLICSFGRVYNLLLFTSECPHDHCNSHSDHSETGIPSHSINLDRFFLPSFFLFLLRSLPFLFGFPFLCSHGSFNFSWFLLSSLLAN